jgi:hypothetical protein
VNEAVVAAALVVAALNLLPAAFGAWVWSRGDPRSTLQALSG